MPPPPSWIAGATSSRSGSSRNQSSGVPSPRSPPSHQLAHAPSRNSVGSSSKSISSSHSGGSGNGSTIAGSSNGGGGDRSKRAMGEMGSNKPVITPLSAPPKRKQSVRRALPPLPPGMRMFGGGVRSSRTWNAGNVGPYSDPANANSNSSFVSAQSGGDSGSRSQTPSESVSSDGAQDEQDEEGKEEVVESDALGLVGEFGNSGGSSHQKGTKKEKKWKGKGRMMDLDEDERNMMESEEYERSFYHDDQGSFEKTKLPSMLSSGQHSQSSLNSSTSVHHHPLSSNSHPILPHHQPRPSHRRQNSTPATRPSTASTTHTTSTRSTTSSNGSLSSSATTPTSTTIPNTTIPNMQSRSSRSFHSRRTSTSALTKGITVPAHPNRNENENGNDFDLAKVTTTMAPPWINTNENGNGAEFMSEGGTLVATTPTANGFGLAKDGRVPGMGKNGEMEASRNAQERKMINESCDSPEEYHTPISSLASKAPGSQQILTEDGDFMDAATRWQLMSGARTAGGGGGGSASHDNTLMTSNASSGSGLGSGMKPDSVSGHSNIMGVPQTGPINSSAGTRGANPRGVQDPLEVLRQMHGDRKPGNAITVQRSGLPNGSSSFGGVASAAAASPSSLPAHLRSAPLPRTSPAGDSGLGMGGTPYGQQSSGPAGGWSGEGMGLQAHTQAQAQQQAFHQAQQQQQQHFSLEGSSSTLTSVSVSPAGGSGSSSTPSSNPDGASASASAHRPTPLPLGGSSSGATSTAPGRRPSSSGSNHSPRRPLVAGASGVPGPSSSNAQQDSTITGSGPNTPSQPTTPNTAGTGTSDSGAIGVALGSPGLVAGNPLSMAGAKLGPAPIVTSGATGPSAAGEGGTGSSQAASSASASTDHLALDQQSFELKDRYLGLVRELDQARGALLRAQAQADRHALGMGVPAGVRFPNAMMLEETIRELMGQKADFEAAHYDFILDIGLGEYIEAPLTATSVPSRHSLSLNDRESEAMSIVSDNQAFVMNREADFDEEGGTETSFERRQRSLDEESTASRSVYGAFSSKWAGGATPAPGPMPYASAAGRMGAAGYAAPFGGGGGGGKTSAWGNSYGGYGPGDVAVDGRRGGGKKSAWGNNYGGLGPGDVAIDPKDQKDAATDLRHRVLDNNSTALNSQDVPQMHMKSRTMSQSVRGPGSHHSSRTPGSMSESHQTRSHYPASSRSQQTQYQDPAAAVSRMGSGSMASIGSGSISSGAGTTMGINELAKGIMRTPSLASSSRTSMTGGKSVTSPVSMSNHIDSKDLVLDDDLGTMEGAEQQYRRIINEWQAVQSSFAKTRSVVEKKLNPDERVALFNAINKLADFKAHKVGFEATHQREISKAGLQAHMDYQPPGGSGTATKNQKKFWKRGKK